jgi:hypothetical protein
MSKDPIPVRPKYPTASAEHIERACFAAFMSASGALKGDAPDACRTLFSSDPVALRILQRSAVDPGTLSTSGWAAELAGVAMAAFLADLAPVSAAAALIARGPSFVFDGYGGAAAIMVPYRSGRPTARSWVGENAPIPVMGMTIAGATLEPYKLGVISVFSRELAKRSEAEAVFRYTLREDASATLDGAYFHSDAAAGDRPAGLLNGVSPISSESDLRWDLGLLATAVGTAGSGEVAFVMGPGRAAALAVKDPELFRSATVLPSLAVAEDTVIAVDPQAVVHGVGSAPTVDAGEEAVLHMDSAPDVEIFNPAAVPTRSLFQTNAMGLRLLVDAAYAKRRAGAVAYMSGIEW